MEFVRRKSLMNTNLNSLMKKFLVQENNIFVQIDSFLANIRPMHFEKENKTLCFGTAVNFSFQNS